MVKCPLLALSGHPLVHCICLLLTQSGHDGGIEAQLIGIQVSPAEAGLSSY